MFEKTPIQKYIENIINGPGGFHAFERTELALPVGDRDTAVAAWVIRCLANPACEGSGDVLDAIIERRKEKVK